MNPLLTAVCDGVNGWISRGDGLNSSGNQFDLQAKWLGTCIGNQQQPDAKLPLSGAAGGGLYAEGEGGSGAPAV